MRRPLNLPPDEVRHIIDSFRAKAKAARKQGAAITAERYERQADEYEARLERAQRLGRRSD